MYPTALTTTISRLSVQTQRRHFLAMCFKLISLGAYPKLRNVINALANNLFQSNSGFSVSELFQITHCQMVIRCSYLWKVRYTEFRWYSDIPDPLQSIFRLHCSEHFQRLPLFQGYSDLSHSDGKQILIS